jgi:hypothetical protein
LSHDNLLDVPCDKDELVDDASVFHVLEPITYAEHKRLLPIATEKRKEIIVFFKYFGLY